MSEHRILIVDDLPMNRAILKKVLHDSGFLSITEASSAEEAFKHLKLDSDNPDKIDLVLLDIVMKDLDGIETCRQIKKHPAGRHIPVIMVTAQSEMHDLSEAFQAGAVDYITRPIQKEELLARVNSALQLKDESDRRRRREDELHESRQNFMQLYTAVFKATSEGIVIFSDHTIKDANDSFSRMVRLPLADIIGTDVKNYFKTENESLINRLFSEEEVPAFEINIQRSDGSSFVSEIETKIIPFRGENAKVLSIRDITERKRSEEAIRSSLEALHISEERYALALKGANDGLWDWNMKTNRVYFSDRWKQMLGYASDELGDNPEEWFKLIHPDDRNEVEQALQAHLDGGSEHFESEHRILSKSGRYLWILSRGIAVRDSTGRPQRMAGSQTDISERKRVENQLLHDAFHDNLTGLPNRALFMDRLSQAIERSRRDTYTSFAVLFLDIDRFKMINDTIGHLSGDEFLIEIADRLKNSLRPGDTVARLGGDEFGILIDGFKEREQVEEIAATIQTALAEPTMIQNREVFPSASIGIAYNDESIHSSDEILRNADIAMYRSKAASPGRYAVFEETMHDKTVTMFHLESDLRKAVENNSIDVHYQPIYSLTKGRIIGFEALARWYHPEKGMIPPAEFIAISEEIGVIEQLGDNILNAALKQVKEWRRNHADIFVSVNFSAMQFLNPTILDKVKKMLKSHYLTPDALKVEITESIAMTNLEMTVQVLEQMNKLGLRVSMDDFGTGYSSLSYLKRFPIETLKIDRSFIMHTPEDADDTAIVLAVIALAKSLRINLIAEGVESHDHVNFLEKNGCHELQGYLIARPAEAHIMTELLDNEYHLT